MTLEEALKDPEWLGDSVEFALTEHLFDLFGPVADTFSMTAAQKTELGRTIVQWVSSNVGFPDVTQ